MSQESNYLAGTGDAALEETLRGAEEMLNSGDLIEAERAFRSVLREHPDNASALRAMGRTAEQGDRKEEALDYFSRAYHTDQDSADFMADLSRIYLKLGNQEMAEHYGRGALQKDQNNAMAAKCLGDSLIAKDDFENAEKCYRRALKQNPEFAEAHNNLGNIFNKQGRKQRAVKAYRRALELKPDLAQTHSNLGILLIEAEQHEEAIEHFAKSVELHAPAAMIYRNMAKAYIALGRMDEAIEILKNGRSGHAADAHLYTQLAELYIVKDESDAAREALEQALALNPALVTPHSLLASVCRHKGDLEGAIIHGRHAVEIDPNSATCHADLAMLLQLHGAFDDALIHYDRALAIDAEFARAVHGRGTLKEETGDEKAAFEAYQAALKLDPEFAAPHVNIGLLLLAKERLPEAMPYFKKAVELSESSPSVHINYGIALAEAGDYAKSEEHYQRALELNPKLAEAHANYGVLCQQLGRLDEAAEHYATALTLKEDFPEALFAVSYLDGKAMDEKVIEKMVGMAEAKRLSDKKRSTLYFAIGKSLDDAGDYDRAFEYVQKGNEIEWTRAEYARQQLSKQVDSAIATYSKSFFEERKTFGSTSKMPIFIVGLPRSGTTLIEQILSSHNRVFGAGELQFLGRMTQNLQKLTKVNTAYPEGMLEVGEPQCLRLAGQMLRYLRRISGGAERVSDKLPFNFFRIGLIALLFPNAKIIHCRRDPLDIFVSGYFLRFRSPIPYTCKQEEFAHFYGEYLRLMEHWQEVSPVPVLDVVYEDMVSDQEAMSRKIVDFCDLEWDERCLEFYKTERPVRTGSNVAVRKPIYDHSVGRWRRFEKFLDPLKEALDAH